LPALLSVLAPDTLDMDALPTRDEHPGDAPGQPSNGPQRRDPSHPLYGIMGTDPRTLDAAQAQDLTDRMTRWIADQARAAL